MRKLTRSPLSTSLLVLCLGVSSASLLSAQQSQSSDVPRNSPGVRTDVVQTEPASSTASPLAAATLPDSPGADWAKLQGASSDQQQATVAQQQNSAPASSSAAQGNAPDDQKLQRPVGTAAAEAPKVSGITAAQPAGVAIAPAKQRRVRTIVLKVGAILGAGAAVGTVVALSKATPSKPPGAH